MSREKIIELKNLLFDLERKIRPLEWDASRRQINDYRKTQLVKLRNEYVSLSKELEEVQGKDL